MKRLLFAVLAVLLLASLLLPARSFASGFALPEQSASAMGMASAFVAQADDPSAVWYNPAAITELGGTRFTGGIVGIFPVLTHETLAGTTEVSERKLHTPILLYLTTGLSDRLSLGIGVNNPFGLATSWGETSLTNFVATFSRVETLNLNPNIAYRVSDRLSLAAGVSYITVDAALEQVLGAGLNFRVDGDGTGYGANLALHYRASDSMKIGLSYRRKIKADLEGDASITTVSVTNPGSTSLTMPDNIKLGISYAASDRMIYNAEIDYTNWSTYDQLDIDSLTFLAITGTTSVTVLKEWQDTVCYRFGAQYKVSDAWKLRFGYLYDTNPVREEYFETRTPDSDRQGLSFGIGHTSGTVTIDAAYLYLHFNPRTINNSLADNVPGETFALNGNYKSQAHIGSVMASFKF